MAGVHLFVPIRDGRGFTLITDASQWGWGAMLTQRDDDGQLRLIDHWSGAHKGYATSAPAFYLEGRAILEPHLSDELQMAPTMLEAARWAVELAGTATSSSGEGSDR